MKISHLRTSKEFTEILSKGKKEQGSIILLSYKKTDKEDNLKAGIIISKKNSPKAIQRNYIRRLTYSYLRSVTRAHSFGISFVIKINKSVRDLKKKDLRRLIETDIKTLAQKIVI